MTEVEAITAWGPLLRNLRDLAIVPNSTALGYEADILRVNEKGVLTEYEVKLTRSDFMADLKKSKHHYFGKARASGKDYRVPPYSGLPHYFVYLAPPGVVDPDAVPEYAGVTEVTESADFLALTAVKRPRRLLRGELPKDVMHHILRAQCRRYWEERRVDAVQAVADANALRIVVPNLRHEIETLKDRVRQLDWLLKCAHEGVKA